MRNLIIFINLLITIFSASSQSIKIGAGAKQPPVVKDLTTQEDKFRYGPVLYRDLSETIGQLYILLPVHPDLLKYGYRELHKKGENETISTQAGAGKILKLISINEKEGFFTDSNNVEYRCELYDGTLTNLTLLSDIEDARNRLINKPLWLNISKYVVGDPYATSGKQVVDNQRFAKVIVTSVVPSYSNDVPVFIIFENDKGQTGYTNAIVSGTNSNLEVPYLFKEKFFTENPQTKYKLSDKTWAAVKAGRTEIGMPVDAVQLIEGRPTKRNKSVIGNIRKEQWVYGETIQSFFYFENGKLTSISR